jgi:hypothetical protein
MAITEVKATDTGFLEFEMEDWTQIDPEEGLWVSSWEETNDEFTNTLRIELLKLNDNNQ